MDTLIAELKQKVVEALNLEELSAEEINENTPLFGLIVLLDKEYGIRLSDPKQGKEIFYSIATMAEYIQKHRTK